MEINNSNKEIFGMIEYPREGVLSKEVFKREGFDCSLFCMSSGTEISEHTSTRKGIVYFLEGEGIFNLEGKDIRMKEGVIIHMDRNAIHSLNAKKDTSFILMLF